MEIRKGFSLRFAHIWFVANREFLISKCTLRLKCVAHIRGGGPRVKDAACIKLAQAAPNRNFMDAKRFSSFLVFQVA